MKTFLGLAIVFSVIGFTSSAEAITITLAEVQNGVAVVQGNKAAKSAIITWDGLSVTQTSKGGSFSFSATVPADCIGTLSDGVSTIDVVVLDCESVSSVPFPVPQTGQTQCWDLNGIETDCTGTGLDGETQAGAPLPSPRFADNTNGTITDKATGLIWLKNANCFGSHSWFQAASLVNNLANGQCGLTDGSSAGDWRIPNIRELLSLVDYTRASPALPSDHPFNGFGGGSLYWSSTVRINVTNENWSVDFSRGSTFFDARTNDPLGLGDYIIAVRGGL